MSTYSLLRIALTTIILYGISQPSSAQDPDDPIAAIRSGMQSPTAASLGRYGDLPVNLHTGGVSVSIPLFEIPGTTLSVPLTLNYQASGIKVSDIAGWVGTGWSLDAGGVITRSVRGLPDESQYGYHFTGDRLYNDEAWFNISDGVFPLIGGGTTWQLLDDIKQGWVDPEPDRFFYNVSGQSGQFVVPPQALNEPIRPIPHAAMRIKTPEGINLWSWEIVDSAGVTYVFDYDDAEITTTQSFTDTSDGIQFSDPETHATSWYLSEMIAPGNSEHIYFSYIDLVAIDRSPHHHTRTHTISGDHIGDCAGVNFNTYSWSNNETQYKVLSSIQTTSHYVTFHHSLRNDATHIVTGDPQHPRLDYILVYKGDPSGDLVRRFDFEYEYFGTGDAKRLFLTEVHESGGDGTVQPPHIFDYYMPSMLPSRYSTDQDHWGFYNAASNASVPEHGPYDMVPPTTSPYFANPLDGVNRDPIQTSEARFGMLTHVRYPTGGSSALTYESNDFGDGLEPSQRTAGVESHCDPNEPAFCGEVVDAFVVNVPSWHTTNATISYNLEPYFGGDGSPTSFVRITEICDNAPCPVVFQASECDGATCTALVSLSSGDYQVSAYPGEYGVASSAWISTQWDDLVEGGFAPAGGVRIAKIEHYNANDDIHTIQYQYEINDYDGYRSSGRLVSIPHYDIFINRTNCDLLQRTSSPRGPLGTTQGSHIGYTHVTEVHGVNGEGGFVDHMYRFGHDVDIMEDGGNSAESNSAFMFNAATSQAWQRGQLLLRVIRDESDELIERTSYSYHFAWNESVHYYPYRALIVSLRYLPTGGDIRVEYFARYHVLSAWVRLGEEVVTRYDAR